ncbi:hypothetical protein MMC13_001140 [Lambiella insularis]|nr:hypothetical protein [Lambiella insularis]
MSEPSNTENTFLPLTQAPDSRSTGVGPAVLNLNTSTIKMPDTSRPSNRTEITWLPLTQASDSSSAGADPALSNSNTSTVAANVSAQSIMANPGLPLAQAPNPAPQFDTKPRIYCFDGKSRGTGRFFCIRIVSTKAAMHLLYNTPTPERCVAGGELANRRAQDEYIKALELVELNWTPVGDFKRLLELRGLNDRHIRACEETWGDANGVEMRIVTKPAGQYVHLRKLDAADRARVGDGPWVGAWPSWEAHGECIW